MSLRGVGKALYRTPHNLFGRKSAEDDVYKQWEHDISISIAGLEYLKLENQKLQTFWRKITSNFILVTNIFLDSHKQIKKNKTQDPDKNEEFADITFHEIEQAYKLAKLLDDRVNNISKASTESFVLKCNEMIKVLKQVQKLMTKRNHKKIDYDMQIKKVDSLLKSANTVEKDKAKLETHQNKLTEVEIIYKDINEKVNLIIPEVLSNFSEFLNKMSYKLYFANRDILRYIQRNIAKFNRVHGVVSDDTILSYEYIINEFNQLHSQGQNKLNELLLLKDFGSMRDKTLAAETTQHVNNAASKVVDTTINFTNTVYTKASKPNQKLSVSLGTFKIDNPVKPYSKAGVFCTALDPINFVKHSDTLSAMDVNEELPTLSSLPAFDPKSELPPVPIEKDSDLVAEQPPAMTNNQDWLKPLKNSTLTGNKPKEEAFTAPPSIFDSDNQTVNSYDATTDTKTSTANYGPSSLNLDITSETYKYISVSVDNITKKIYMIVTQPELTRTPLILKDNEFKPQDKLISNIIMAKSSITANAFASFYSL